MRVLLHQAKVDALLIRTGEQRRKANPHVLGSYGVGYRLDRFAQEA